MSANLDLVRSIYAGWERGDFSSNDGADTDIEFSFAGGPEPESRTGLAGMAQGYRNWLRAWKDFRAQPESYRVIDSERILVLVRNSGLGRVSGVEIEERSVANLFHVRGGKVARIVVYLDRQLASPSSGSRRTANDSERARAGSFARRVMPDSLPWLSFSSPRPLL